MTAMIFLLAVLATFVVAGVARCLWVLAYASSPQRQIDDRLRALRRPTNR